MLHKLLRQTATINTFLVKIQLHNINGSQLTVVLCKCIVMLNCVSKIGIITLILFKDMANC